MKYPTYVMGGDVADWDLIPDHMRGAMRRYVENGLPPGSFLEAVLSNDLRGAVSRADHINKHQLPNYVQFLANAVPASCHGSSYAVNDWIKGGGLKWPFIDNDN